MKRIRILKIFSSNLVVSVCMSFILMLYGSIAQAVDLPKVIDKKNCAQFKDLIIPAMYRAVERGDYVITPGKLNFKYKHADSFLAASEKNEGKFDVTPDGNLIDKHSGKYPENLYGLPFPKIDLKDPKAGAKIIANFNFQRYRFMASREQLHVMWIDQKGEERYIQGLDQRLYMNGRPPGQEINNPDKFLSFEFRRVLEPMSARGTNTLTKFFMDDKENISFAYIPAIRRIRQTPSTSRSDPFMGSDSWMDTNFMWFGKDNSMTWKYVGEKTILVSFTSPDMLPVQELQDGRINKVFPYTGMHPKLGFQDPKWKGASWTPLNITYVPRKVWVVEQVPKDPYYTWGLHVNYVDQKTYTIWYKEVYEKSGDFRTWITTLLHYSESPSGKNNTGDFDAQLFIDEKAHHATTTSRSTYSESFLYMPASKLSPKFFTTDNFMQLSK